MLILAIETTGPLASCALWDGAKMTQSINHTEYSHLEEIAPMVQRLLKDEGVDPDALDAIAVSRGPGSFTGVRIGMATVKGLAQIWGKPVIEVPTLASFAFGQYSWLGNPEKTLICPLFDARRSQVYSGVYLPGCRQPLIEDAAYGIEELMEKIRNMQKASSAEGTDFQETPDGMQNISAETVRGPFDSIVFFGDGIKVYKDQLPYCAIPYEIAHDKDLYQVASSVARLGGELFAAGQLKDCYTCQPEYLRLAEAERKLKEKQ